MSGDVNVLEPRLKKLIFDIEKCTDSQQAANRINKELTKIRGLTSKQNLDSKVKAQCALELIYIYCLDYEMREELSMTIMSCVDLQRHDGWFEKFVGYTGILLLATQFTDVMCLTVGSLIADLISKNEFNVCLALACVANVGTVSNVYPTSDSVVFCVQELLLSGYVNVKSLLL